MNIERPKFILDYHNNKLVGIVDEKDPLDIYIKIDGNFETRTHRVMYYEKICDILNMQLDKEST